MLSQILNPRQRDKRLSHNSTGDTNQIKTQYNCDKPKAKYMEYQPKKFSGLNIRKSSICQKKKKIVKKTIDSIFVLQLHKQAFKMCVITYLD